MRQTGVSKNMAQMPRKLKRQAQEDYQLEMQALGFNLVDCGSCGSTFLHRTRHEELECPFCDFRSEPCDFPDHFHVGFSESAEFDDVNTD